jgi:uncharacterized small protein (DUF1192 family)
MSERVSSEYALHLKIVQLEQRIKELEEEVERLKRQLQGAWRFQDALSSLD